MTVEFYNVFEFAIVRDQLIANTVLVALSTLAIGLRFLSRRIRQSKVWWDDACIVMSMVRRTWRVGPRPWLTGSLVAHLRHARDAVPLCAGGYAPPRY